MKVYSLTVVLLFTAFVSLAQTTIVLTPQCDSCSGGQIPGSELYWEKVGAQQMPSDSIYTLGNVGIGTTDPEFKLHIVSDFDSDPLKIEDLKEDTSNTRVLVIGADGIVRFQNTAAGTQNFAVGDHDFYSVNDGGIPNHISNDIYTMGHVGIGTSLPTQSLHVVGNALKTVGGASWLIPSDRDLKKEIQPFSAGLAELEQVNTYSYYYDQSKMESAFGTNTLTEQKEYGIIAEELFEIAPEMMQTYQGADGEIYYLVNQSNFTLMLINAVKELSDRLNKVEQITTDNMVAE